MKDDAAVFRADSYGYSSVVVAPIHVNMHSLLCIYASPSIVTYSNNTLEA